MALSTLFYGRDGPTVPWIRQAFDFCQNQRGNMCCVFTGVLSCLMLDQFVDSSLEIIIENFISTSYCWNMVLYASIENKKALIKNFKQ